MIIRIFKDKTSGEQNLAQKQKEAFLFKYAYKTAPNPIIGEFKTSADLAVCYALLPTDEKVIGFASSISALPDFTTPQHIEALNKLFATSLVVLETLNDNFPSAIGVLSTSQVDALSFFATFKFSDKLELTCAFYSRLLSIAPTFTFEKIKLWASQLAPNGILSYAVFNNPPAFQDPEPLPPVSGSSIKFNLLAPVDGTYTETFDIGIFSKQKNALKSVNFIAAPETTLDNYVIDNAKRKLTLNFDPNSSNSGRLILRTAEPALDDEKEEAQTTLDFNVNFIQKVRITPPNGKETTFRPGTTGRKFTGQVKFYQDPNWYDMNDHAKFREKTGIKDISAENPLLSWSIEGGKDLFAIDTSGNITVPTNNLLSTGPFKSDEFLWPEKGQQVMITSTGTQAEVPELFAKRMPSSFVIQGAEIGRDYEISSLEPLKIKVLSNERVTIGSKVSLIYNATRTITEFYNSQFWGKGIVELKLNANYIAAPVQQSLSITPPIQWYPLISPEGAFADSITQIITNKIQPFSDFLSGTKNTLVGLRGTIDGVKKFLPLLALLDGFRLDSVIQALAGPLIEQLINILGTGLYFTYMLPDEESLVNRGLVSKAAYEAKLTIITGSILPASVASQYAFFYIKDYLFNPSTYSISGGSLVLRDPFATVTTQSIEAPQVESTVQDSEFLPSATARGSTRRNTPFASRPRQGAQAPARRVVVPSVNQATQNSSPAAPEVSQATSYYEYPIETEVKIWNSLAVDGRFGIFSPLQLGVSTFFQEQNLQVLGEVWDSSKSANIFNVLNSSGFIQLSKKAYPKIYDICAFIIDKNPNTINTPQRKSLLTALVLGLKLFYDNIDDKLSGIEAPGAFNDGLRITRLFPTGSDLENYFQAEESLDITTWFNFDKESFLILQRSLSK